MDNVQFNFVGPLAPIIGAIVGAAIAAAVTYYLVVKRKAVTSVINDTEDLTSALGGHGQLMTVKIGNREVARLMKGGVIIRNSGNSPVKDMSFEIDLDGSPGFWLSVFGEGSDELKKAITIEQGQASGRGGPPRKPVKVSVPFLNPKESFGIDVFFDGWNTPECTVSCRMEDVYVKTRKASAVRDLVLEQAEGLSFSFFGVSFGISPRKSSSRRVW